MNNELYHHGRRYQKWGVENGPPYPLYRQEEFGKAGAYEKKMTRASKTSTHSGSSSSPKKSKTSSKGKIVIPKFVARQNNFGGLLDKLKPASKMSEEEKKQAEAAKRQRDIITGNLDPSELSDEELDNALNRLRKQNEYLRAVGKKTPQEIAQSKYTKEQLTQDIVKAIGQDVIRPAAAGAAQYALANILTKHTKLSDEAVRTILSRGWDLSKVNTNDMMKRLGRELDANQNQNQTQQQSGGLFSRLMNRKQKQQPSSDSQKEKDNSQKQQNSNNNQKQQSSNSQKQPNSDSSQTQQSTSKRKKKKKKSSSSSASQSATTKESQQDTSSQPNQRPWVYMNPRTTNNVRGRESSSSKPYKWDPEVIRKYRLKGRSN